MTIAILTMFNGLKESYSLVSSVKAQTKILAKNGHNVKILLSQHCPDEEIESAFNNPKIKFVKITNSINGQRLDWQKITQDQQFFDNAANVIANEYEKALQTSEVCILHDILYQDLHLVHNAAIRIVQKRLLGLKFIAFAHSVPLAPIQANYPRSLLFCDMPNTIFVTPSEFYRPSLAAQYNIDINRCAVVPTAFDIIDTLTSEVKAISKICDFYAADFVIVYPARAAGSKAHNLLIKLAGAIKRISKQSVLIVFCDTVSSDAFYKTVFFEAEKNGILKSELICTGHLFPEGISKRSVLDLFLLSNLMIFPSLAETQGLIMAEAASCGNIIIVNKRTQSLKKIAEEFNALMFDFGAENPFDIQDDYDTSVCKLLESINSNPIFKAKTAARKNYAPDLVYKKYLQPLILKSISL